MDKGSPELLTTEAMSAPIPEKDKTPVEKMVEAIQSMYEVPSEQSSLMLLEERVKALEEKVKALDIAHYTPTPGIDDGIFDPGITPCATSDPQEPCSVSEELLKHWNDEFERCRDKDYFITNYMMVKSTTTSDPQEPYKLDTKPR